MKGGVSMRCPHCQSRAQARTSKALSSTMREITYACRNHECAFVWVATLEATRVISPSAVPNTEVQLPLSPHIKRAELVSSISSAAQLSLSMEMPP